MIRDLQLAADRLKRIFDRTHDASGYVCLELPPQVVSDAQMALSEARRFWQAVGWSNFMLSIPATSAMLPVIEQLISEGIHVNVTLVSTLVMYEQVAIAYCKGLEALSQEKSIDTVTSLISFPVASLDETANSRLRTAENREEQVI